MGPLLFVSVHGGSVPLWLVWRSQIGVDLSALKGTGKVGVADLRLRVELVDFPSTLAVPVSCLFYTAERKVRLRSDGWCIHVRNAVVELVERSERRVHIARIDRRRQPVLHIVVHSERLVRILDAND